MDKVRYAEIRERAMARKRLAKSQQAQTRQGPDRLRAFSSVEALIETALCENPEGEARAPFGVNLIERAYSHRPPLSSRGRAGRGS